MERRYIQVQVSNAKHSTILRKMKDMLLKLNRDSSLFTYKEVRGIREEVQKIKRLYYNVLCKEDVSNLKDIEKLLAKLKRNHPHLCSKESYINILNTENLINKRGIISTTICSSCNLTHDQTADCSKNIYGQQSMTGEKNEASMELDESLMQYNDNKSKASLMNIETKKEYENQLPVASVKAQESNVSSLNHIQKLYLQSLELWQCVDKFEIDQKSEKLIKH